MERGTALTVDGSSQRHVRERGAALFLAIFALAAIGFVSLKLVSRATAYSQLLRIHGDGLAHHTALRESIEPITSRQRRCELQQLSGRSIAGLQAQSSPWYICTTGQPAFLSNHDVALPASSPDYGALFDTSIPCPYQRGLTALRAFDAPIAPHTCLLPPAIQGDFIVVDNISVESTAVAPHTPSRTITIATPGSLTSSTSLTVPGDTLIVAGGTVTIATLRLLQAPSVAPTTTVTIMSAHGDIVIERIEGSLSLLALGRRVISVPETRTPHSPPLPPVRAPSVTGFVPR
jgi:hypothetical protein